MGSAGRGDDRDIGLLAIEHLLGVLVPTAVISGGVSFSLGARAATAGDERGIRNVGDALGDGFDDGADADDDDAEVTHCFRLSKRRAAVSTMVRSSLSYGAGRS